METFSKRLPCFQVTSRRYILLLALASGLVLFAANNMMGFGALKYLHESGRNKVTVAAYDALDEARAEVKLGHLTVTVDQQASEQGFQGMALATRLINGEAVPAVMLIDTRLVSAAQTH